MFGGRKSRGLGYRRAVNKYSHQKRKKREISTIFDVSASLTAHFRAHPSPPHQHAPSPIHLAQSARLWTLTHPLGREMGTVVHMFPASDGRSHSCMHACGPRQAVHGRQAEACWSRTLAAGRTDQPTAGSAPLSSGAQGHPPTRAG